MKMIAIALVTGILLITSVGCRRHRVTSTPNAATASPKDLAAPKDIAPQKDIAPKRDINVVLVLDRSGSLQASGSCQPLIEAATSFVNRFTPDRDKVGLVTFATSTYVNFPISSAFQTANPNIATVLAHVTCAGSTSSAQALWTGYQQIIGLDQPNAVNIILFFTDGEPTGVTFDMPVANSSPCTEYTPGSPTGPGGYAMPPTGKGYIRGVYNTFSNASQWYGPLNPMGIAGPDGLQIVARADLQPAANSAGCDYFRGWSGNGVGNLMVPSDFLGVPTKDIYGNSAATAYHPVTLNSYGFIDLANGNNAQAMALNAADSAATNIRNGAVDPVSGRSIQNVIIYSVGLGGAAYPASSEFLTRVSNDPNSPVYDSSKPSGRYLHAVSMADLESMFNSVAEQIARLARL
jgi:von Willebrand factor type A domain